MEFTAELIAKNREQKQQIIDLIDKFGIDFEITEGDNGTYSIVIFEITKKELDEIFETVEGLDQEQM